MHRPETPARERLTRDAIVAQALQVADDDGLDAVTIRRLATELGVTPMALYRHFREKHDLLDGVADHLLGRVILPAAADDLEAGGPWHQRLHGALAALVTALRPHPALASLVPARLLVSDPGLRLAEYILAALREGEFSAKDAAEVGSYLVCAVPTLITAQPGPRRPMDQEVREMQIRLTRAGLGALSPREFPNLIDSAASLAECTSEDFYYARGLELLVGGTRVLRKTAPPGPAAEPSAGPGGARSSVAGQAARDRKRP